MCFRLTVPTIVVESGAPFSFPFTVSTPAALRSSHDVDGVRNSKWNDRSGRTVTLAGTGVPGFIWEVLALNSLQKSIDLTPLLPSAGPTGGLGLACPAPTMSFTITSEAARAFDISIEVLIVKFALVMKAFDVNLSYQNFSLASVALSIRF